MVVNGKSPRAATSNTHIIHHNSDPLSRMLTRLLLLQSSWTTLTVNTWPPVRSAQVYLYLFQQRCEDNTDTLYSCQKLKKKQGYFTVIRRAWQDSPVTQGAEHPHSARFGFNMPDKIAISLPTNEKLLIFHTSQVSPSVLQVLAALAITQGIPKPCCKEKTWESIVSNTCAVQYLGLDSQVDLFPMARLFVWLKVDV